MRPCQTQTNTLLDGEPKQMSNDCKFMVLTGQVDIDWATPVSRFGATNRESLSSSGVAPIPPCKNGLSTAPIGTSPHAG